MIQPAKGIMQSESTKAMTIAGLAALGTGVAQSMARVSQSIVQTAINALKSPEGKRKTQTTPEESKKKAKNNSNEDSV